jgi:uncharacterized protein involved in outer membrane biogenesis
VGQFSFDGRLKALASHVALDVKDVRLEQLVPALSKGKNAGKGAGALQGFLDLKGDGDSIAKLAASTSGQAHIEMDGGAISNLLDAEIALNAGKALKVLVKGDRAIGVNNATAAFDFEKGIGKSRSIVLDTDQTHTQGTGTIDLRDETIELLLTPHPKKTAVLALHSSIRVHGPIRRPKISLAEKTNPGSRKAEGAAEETKEPDKQSVRKSGERASDLHDTPVAQPTGRK